ncbi:MAG: PEP-CTERM sorting domain-containing protein [Verrucomicrobia bacterium]|nr:PEP-CTERM sorting domain-containing protein [Verrucomicrobiota bacterium]
MKNSIKLAFLVAAAAILTPAQAAVIAWGNATDIAAATDVSTTGTALRAYNISGSAATVNGVNFTAESMGANVNTLSTGDTLVGSGGATWANFTGFGSASNPFDALNTSSPSYGSLLSTGTYPLGGSILTFTFNNLNIGYSYQVQIWTNDSRGGNKSTPIDGGAVTLNTNPTTLGGGLGQFAIGTFTANATSQSFTLDNNSYLNAVQLRQTAIPEPSTYMMLLGGAGALMLLRRRRTV